MAGTSKHDFSLPEEDEILLKNSFSTWETVKDNNVNWVIIHDFDLIPKEYGCNNITVAFEIPVNYPIAQIDMFYVYPPLSLPNKQIPRTEGSRNICSKTFQRWSRHRTSKNPWQPGLDNVYSQVMLTEEMLEREVNR